RPDGRLLFAAPKGHAAAGSRGRLQSKPHVPGIERRPRSKRHRRAGFATTERRDRPARGALSQRATPAEGLTPLRPRALFAVEPAASRIREHSGPTGRCLLRHWPPRRSATTIKPTPEGRLWRTDGAG